MHEYKLNNAFIEKLTSKGFYLYSDTLEDFNLGKFQEDIRDLFSSFFSKEYIKENLSIPDQYIDFLCCIRGYLHNSWDYFHGAGLVLSDIKYWLDLYDEEFKEMENTENVLRLHISIAPEGDKHVILLNCD